MENAQENEKDSCHEGGNGESLHTILLDDTIDDDDEGTGRTADLYLTATENRNHQSCNNSSDNTFLGRYT